MLPALVFGLAACGPGRLVPRDQTDIPGYVQTPPDLVGVDASPLRGRRILVDPGHGGRFPGAVGQEGLSEADVNLGVALYLQGLLQWAGADVQLTRTADVDFLTPADSSLTADLAARVALCDSLQPDVFVSIHHNSTASRDPDINETQTYYPLGREGADLDLARAVHRQLVRALEIAPAKILPGGFHVLRNATVPAILGEPAMISNPVIEGRLSLARSLELEASAYFLGLREYFAAGTPRWRTSLPDTVDVGRDPAPAAWTFDSGADGAPGLDPASIAVTIDGVPTRCHLDVDDRTVTIDGRRLAEAGHVSVAARNLAGRATPIRSHTVVHPEAHPWHVVCLLDGEPADSRRGVLLYFADHLPPHGGPLLFASPDARTDAVSVPRPRRGQGCLMLDPLPADAERRTIVEPDLGDVASTGADARTVVRRLPTGTRSHLLVAPEDVWPHDTVPGGAWRLRHRPTTDSAHQINGVSTTDLDPGWPTFPHRLGNLAWIEADGALPLLLDDTGHSPWEDPAAAPADTLVWQPLLPALIGKRIAVDPRGGGIDEQGRGPYGTRGSDLNLQVAGRLAALLRGAGCEVRLLRDDDSHTPDPTKVRRADAFGADLYMTLGRGAPAVRHHPGSQLGTPWATACAAALAPLLADTVTAEPRYDYVLRHTACPAVVVMLEEPVDEATEQRLTAPSWQNAVARALFAGTVELFEPDTPGVRLPELIAALGAGALDAATLDLVRLDGNLQWLPPYGPRSKSSVTSWQTGDRGLPARGDLHVLELRAGSRWQLWTLDRSPSGDWHGRMFLENR